MPELILLCGFSGSGKTDTGKRLAEILGYGFTDSDATVEEVLGKTIPEIFLKLGEATFRFAESNVLRMAVERRPQVIALGGGTIAHGHNLSYVKDHGCLVYLRVTPETIYERLQKSHLRPMLQVVAQEAADRREAAMKRIRRLLEERETYYLKADLIIDADDKTTDEVAAEIAERLRSHG